MRIFVASAALALFVGCTKPSVALIKNVTHSTNAVFEVHGEEPIPLSTGEMATIKRIVERFADHPHLMEKKAIPTCYGSFRLGGIWLGWTGRELCLYDPAVKRYFLVEDSHLQKLTELYTLNLVATPGVRSLTRDQWQRILATLESAR